MCENDYALRIQMNEHPRRVFSSRLVDLEGPECNYPKCKAPGRQRATGWLEFSRDFNHWMYECSCSDPDHGSAFISHGPLRNEVIAALEELRLTESSELPLDDDS